MNVVCGRILMEILRDIQVDLITLKICTFSVSMVAYGHVQSHWFQPESQLAVRDW